MRLFILFLLSLCLAQGAMAQPFTPDSNYVRRFPYSITARLYLQEKVSAFKLTDRRLKQDMNFYPNNYLAVGAGLTIRGFGLNLSVGVPFRDKKESLYGHTRKLDLQLHRYKNHWAADGYFQYYRGFHLRDVSAVTQLTTPEPYPYFPDLRAITLGASLLYMPQGLRHSMGASWNQQEWQIKTGGTFLYGAAFFGHFVSNRGKSILPEYSSHPEFLDSARPAYIHNYALTLRGGYAYTLVYKKHWFVATALDLGAGPGFSTSQEVSGAHAQKLGLNMSATGRLAMGYNAEKWYAGVIGIIQADRFPLAYDRGVGYATQGVVRLVVARRLFFKGGHSLLAPK